MLGDGCLCNIWYKKMLDVVRVSFMIIILVSLQKKVGCTLGVSPPVMGLVVLAVGTRFYTAFCIITMDGVNTLSCGSPPPPPSPPPLFIMFTVCQMLWDL